MRRGGDALRGDKRDVGNGEDRKFRWVVESEHDDRDEQNTTDNNEQLPEEKGLR